MSNHGPLRWISIPVCVCIYKCTYMCVCMYIYTWFLKGFLCPHFGVCNMQLHGPLGTITLVKTDMEPVKGHVKEDSSL